ncbi:MAG: glycosyltransferase family 4 protein [Sedimentisphaerales bacterium]|nr:glycosyltransferase family 4 protein [Sedimentisphaerales bacterium]
MKEIVFIRQSSASMGGIQWQIVKLAEKLFSLQHFKPVLITSDRQSPFAKTFAANGFEVFIAPISKTTLFSAAKEVSKILKNRDIAIIQTPIIESFIARIVRKERSDFQHILRAEVSISGASNSLWKKKFCHLLDRVTSRWVDCYIANGQYVADEIITLSRITPNKVITLLNGIDAIGLPDEVYDKPDEPLPAKIAMVANLTPGKGHDCLINALAILKKKNLIINARFIGGELDTKKCNRKKQGFMSSIKKLADSLDVSNQIEFYGYTKDVFGALSGIPVVVLPSESEGVPNCILEAMSLRKLVVASKTGGVGEIIKHGETGFLHQPKDCFEFADCLENIFNTPAGRWECIRTAAFKNWQQNFTSDIMVDKLVEIYKTLGVL